MLGAPPGDAGELVAGLGRAELAASGRGRLRLLRRPRPGRSFHGLRCRSAHLAQRGAGGSRRRFGCFVLPPELRRRVVDAAVGRVPVVGALRRPFAAVATSGAALFGRARRRATLRAVPSHLAPAACTAASRASGRPNRLDADRAAECRRCGRSVWRRRPPTGDLRSSVDPTRACPSCVRPCPSPAGRASVARPGVVRAWARRRGVRLRHCARRARRRRHEEWDGRRRERWSHASALRRVGAVWDRSQQIASVGGRAAYAKTPASMGGRLLL